MTENFVYDQIVPKSVQNGGALELASKLKDGLHKNNDSYQR